ncbi:hypothetical protein [Olleya sp. R77988]|uniref:hypothetical protein n=1 Tax=Olleya sp. R77988 TaxID=3093875 RepID=UPI0037C82F99
MNLIKQTSLFIIILFITSCNTNTEEVELKLNYNANDTQTIVSTVETSKGALMNIKNVIEAKLKVNSIDKKDITFNTKIVRISTEMKMDDQVEFYDSDSEKELSMMTEDEKVMHQDFKKIIDSDYNIIIDKKGNIIKPFYYLDGKSVNEPIIDIGNVFLRFPSKKVKIGSGWQGEKKNPLTDQITKTTYRVKDINENEIIITLDLDISGIPGLFGDFKGNGEYKLDKKTCKLIKGTLQMELHTGGNVTNTYEAK